MLKAGNLIPTIIRLVSRAENDTTHAVAWPAQNFSGGPIFFTFKRETVFCKQIGSIFSGDYFYYLADVSPTYSSRLPQSNIFNHITCNLPITKNNEQCDVQKQKAQNLPSRYSKLVTVSDCERGR